MIQSVLLLMALSLVTVGCADSPDEVRSRDVGTDLPAADMDSTQDAGADMSDTELEQILSQLRASRDETILRLANESGWPYALAEGVLVVTTDTTMTHVAGDFDEWQGVALNQDAGFSWQVLEVESTAYKFTNLTDWSADPWSRAYAYDEFGPISWLRPNQAHLERFFEIGDASIQPRQLRIWVPDTTQVSHLLYAHDGQNLFDPQAIGGGWRLHESIPAGMMVVGIDNTDARMDEYTHVVDDIGAGPVGGRGNEYADFVHTTVRDLVRTHYGEPQKIGLMGSSLGGLISFHIADRHQDEYIFAASLSGTMGWGSITTTNETMIERYATAGQRSTALYLDSGGQGDTCPDSDGDGINDDDPTAADNYCENKQLESVLLNAGYVAGETMWHWHEPGAPHNESAWANRVFRPLEIFSNL